MKNKSIAKLTWIQPWNQKETSQPSHRERHGWEPYTHIQTALDKILIRKLWIRLAYENLFLNNISDCLRLRRTTGRQRSSSKDDKMFNKMCSTHSKEIFAFKYCNKILRKIFLIKMFTKTYITLCVTNFKYLKLPKQTSHSLSVAVFWPSNFL